MSTDSISFQATGYFSELICDYLAEDDALKPFYYQFPNLDNFKKQLEEKALEFPVKSRIILSDTLSEQYKNLKTSEITLNNIKSLKESNTFTVTTGHQLNLFTGPLYFLHKIVSTINLAKQLKEKFPASNFVPIYWMATEDHDFEEINYFNFKGKKLRWNRKASGPVGAFDTKGLEDVYAVFAKELGVGDNANMLRALFKKAYLEHNNLADATRYLANALFKAYGLVVVEANTRDLKSIFIPYLEKELKEQVSFKTVSETNGAIENLEGKNYPVQVNPREINLFYITEGLRERIIYEANVFKVLNTKITWSQKEVLAEVNEHPEHFSPNVILRPLYQEVILPNLCYIGGGGELAYWFQLKTNFEANSILFPILLIRNSVLIKTQKQAQKLEKLNISNEDIFLKRNNFINKKVRSISNIDIDFSEQIEHLEAQFKTLYKLAEQTDESFTGAVAAQEKKQINGLKHLEKRLLTAQKRKLKDQVERMTGIQNELFPNGSLQERNTNFSELYMAYGEQLIPELLKNLDPLKGEFTILTL